MEQGTQKMVRRILKWDIFAFLVLIDISINQIAMTKFDLEERTINFSVNIIQLAEKLPRSSAGLYFSKQMIRSASSVALNYAEAQSGESRKDFIHKLMIALKELRETSSALKIVYKLKMSESNTVQENLLKENNELISIFMQSIKTARNNMKNE